MKVASVQGSSNAKCGHIPIELINDCVEKDRASISGIVESGQHTFLLEFYCMCSSIQLIVQLKFAFYIFL